MVYDLLGALDESDCPKIPSDEFDAFIERRDVNLVSYALLEARLLDSEEPLRDEAVEAYFAQYRQANVDLDENAILPLIDIAYHQCLGNQTCIGSRVGSVIRDAPLTPRASCLYAMPGECAADAVAPRFFFLNDPTLQSLSSPEQAFERRAEFICNRYRDCAHE